GHPHRRHLADDDPRLDAARPGTRRLHGGTMTTPSTAGGAPSRVSAPRGTPAGLTIDGLCKSYGSVRALDDVGFSVRPGEIFGFVGSNGAGKTTTMRIALGVLAADAGEVRIGDRPVDLDVRRTVGYMPEERGLYPKMRVGAQLSYLAELHGLSLAESADAVERWTQRLGIAERTGDTVDALSLG